MSSKLKSNMCNELIKNNLVKEYDVIEHSYTDGGRRNINRLIVSQDGIFPTLTTRPDCLGVVVKDEK